MVAAAIGSMFICESRLYARHPAQPRSFHDVKISAQSIDLDQSLPFARQSAQLRRLPWLREGLNKGLAQG